jgi:hypothetical protein
MDLLNRHSKLLHLCMQKSDESLAGSESTEKKKVPRRILHFSDGILEEFSTDEDEDQEDTNNETPVDLVSWY